MVWLGLTVLGLSFAGPCLAQGLPELKIERSDGTAGVVPISADQGYEVVPLWAFEDLGWSVAGDSSRITATAPDSSTLMLWSGTAFFRWRGHVLQLASAPYIARDSLQIPVQIFKGFLPRWFPDRYAYDTTTATLRVRGPGSAPPDTSMRPDTLRPDASGGERDPAALRRPSPYDGKKVVVIDAGHGGIDPGAISRSGIEEKVVALAIAKDLQHILSRDSSLQVYMTRTTDRLVPLWTRGEEADKWKGSRPGIFVSIHCNSFPKARDIRGFETYFLAAARTDHERRVAANENAPLHLEKGTHPGTDLDAILHSLRILDYQHWSALLAQMIENDLTKVDPSPDRGVKQGPFAVLTNTLMPAVLVEVGYLSNAAEARMLDRPEFQHKAAGAIAEAVKSFFGRYPPGGGATEETRGR